MFGELSRLDLIEGGDLFLAAAASSPSLEGRPFLLNLPHQFLIPFPLKPSLGFKETMRLREVRFVHQPEGEFFLG